MAFPKRARLPVQKFLKKKAVARRAHGFLVKKFRAEFGYSRVGVVVSRAVAGKAVRRNRLRRIVLRVLADILPSLSIPLDILIIAEPVAARLSYAEARTVLANLLISPPHQNNSRK